MSTPYAYPVGDPAEASRTRPGRCANHTGTAASGPCDACGRPLCPNCLVPVRGRLIGPECLPDVLDGIPGPIIVPTPKPEGDLLAAAGFAAALLLTLPPWSRFAAVSGPLEAWFGHWALLAAVAAALGVAIVVLSRLRPLDQRLQAATYLLLAVAVGLGAILHRIHPPPLSETLPTSLLVLVCALLALAGAGWKVAVRWKANGRWN